VQIPSLISSSEKKDVLSIDKSQVVAKNVRVFGWVGYPVSALAAWYWIPALFTFVLWWIQLLLMFGGFYLTSRSLRWARQLRKAKEQTRNLSPLEMYTVAFEVLEEASFRSAAEQGREILNAVSALPPSNKASALVIDEAFRFHLSFLLRIAETSAAVEGQKGQLEKVQVLREGAWPQRHLKEQQLREEELEFRKRKRGKVREGYHLKLGALEIADNKEFSGVRFGNVFIGDSSDFSGIRIGDIEIGDSKGQRKKKSASDEMSRTPSAVVPQDFRLPPALTGFQGAVQHSLQEIKYLKGQAEDLLLRSVRGDFEKTSSELRERLEREKRVLEELDSFKP
jgi:hypothetical protein